MPLISRGALINDTGEDIEVEPDEEVEVSFKVIGGELRITEIRQ